MTDHLRCPEEHAEAFLVLLPEMMEQRRVVAGHLGCPVCGWNTDWHDSVPDFGGRWRSQGAPVFDADAAIAMLGISGPGGWIALAGNAAALFEIIVAQLVHVNVVLLNPPDPLMASRDASAIMGDRWPIKSHALRGVVLGSDVSLAWRDAAIGSTLPGLRVVGSDPLPSRPVDVLGHADGIWVASHR